MPPAPLLSTRSLPASIVAPLEQYEPEHRRVWFVARFANHLELHL
jgi:hypothetical protein